MTENAPPHGITLAAHAQISAELAEGTKSQREVLESHALTEQQWNESTAYWMPQLASDAQARGAEATLAVEYSEAFAAAQDSLAPPAQMTPEEWATLTVEIQSEGSTSDPLARRNLSLADYLRLARHMAKRLSSNPLEQQRFMDRYLALQPSASG